VLEDAVLDTDLVGRHVALSICRIPLDSQARCRSSGSTPCARAGPDAHQLFFAQQCGSYDTSQGFRICAGPGAVCSIDRNAGPLHTVVSGDTGFVGVAIDRDTVYFTNQFNGTLQSAPR
jgi:hypothetical protein